MEDEEARVGVGMLKSVAVGAELGEDVPEIGIGYRETDYDFMVRP